MGQRANLILIQNDRDYKLYYSHWAANSLDSTLFWGPVHAIHYILSQQKVEKDQWLDNNWSEGSVLLDPYQKVLLWYGGESTRYDARYRHAFLQLMRIPWKDWDVRWAYNEMVDLADYVGHSREAVLGGAFHDERRALLDPEKDGQAAQMYSVLSVRDEDGNTRIIPLYNPVSNYLLSGPAFLDKLDQIPTLNSLSVDLKEPLWFEEPEPTLPRMCEGGIHLNLPDKKIDYWGKSQRYGDIAYITSLWPGWEVTKHYDEYEWQEIVTNRALQLVFDTEAFFLQKITDTLLRHTRESSVELFLTSMHNIRHEAEEVTINPDVFIDTPVELSDGEKWHIWTNAVEELYGFEEMDRQKKAFVQRREEYRETLASLQSNFSEQEPVQPEWKEEMVQEVGRPLSERFGIAAQVILAILVALIIIILTNR
ncbi:MAG: hypothetical protein IT262_15010 [Saprospiraceae bacterium]|nr:hypothetical protein [Saprospiraceae bacterium]